MSAVVAVRSRSSRRNWPGLPPAAREVYSVKPVRPTGHAGMLRAAVILVLVTLAGGVVAAPAQAAASVQAPASAQAAAYRYWVYWHLDEKGAWAFAKTGPAQVVPAEGSVEGWRFAVTGESAPRKPRATQTFDALCASTPVKAGSKRVGLLIDYGRAADSADSAQPPPARTTCVAVPEKATGSDVLAAGATLRLDKAAICGIDGWPATDCFGIVDPVPAAATSPDIGITIAAPKASTAASPAAQPDESGSSSPLRLALGAAAVVLVGALGFAAWRRNRDATAD
jgi:hypothetical protein